MGLGFQGPNGRFFVLGKGAFSEIKEPSPLPKSLLPVSNPVPFLGPILSQSSCALEDRGEQPLLEMRVPQRWHLHGGSALTQRHLGPVRRLGSDSVTSHLG